MRLLLGMLLLANIAFWMWGSWYKKEPEAHLPRAQPAFAPDKMRSLSEPDVRARLRLLKTAQAPVVITEPQAAALVSGACYQLGPFLEVEQLQQAGERLKGLGLAFEKTEEVRTSLSGFRVILPPLPTPQAAERRRQELTRLGFSDHALIDEEGLANAISLGLFTIEGNADRHLEKLSAKGIKAEKQPLFRSRTLYWLDIPAFPEESVHLTGGLLKHDWGVPGAAFRDTDCGYAQPPTDSVPP